MKERSKIEPVAKDWLNRKRGHRGRHTIVLSAPENFGLTRNFKQTLILKESNDSMGMIPFRQVVTNEQKGQKWHTTSNHRICWNLEIVHIHLVFRKPAWALDAVWSFLSTTLLDSLTSSITFPTLIGICINPTSSSNVFFFNLLVMGEARLSKYNMEDRMLVFILMRDPASMWKLSKLGSSLWPFQNWDPITNPLYLEMSFEPFGWSSNAEPRVSGYELKESYRR